MQDGSANDAKLCRLCTIALPLSKQRHSLDPAPAFNKTVVESLATVSPELELANGSLCKAWFTKLEKAATYLAMADNITNELREKLAFAGSRGQLYVIAYNYAFCNLIRAFRSGSYPAPFDKKSRSEHQTLFLTRARRVWA